MSRNKKTRILIIVLTALAVLAIMLFSILPDSPSTTMSSPLSVLLRPVEKIFSGIGEGVSGFFGAIKENAELKSENERLLEENFALRLEIKDNEQAAEAYADLKEAFSLKDLFPNRIFVAANILQGPLEDDFDFYRIDIGRRDGLNFDEEPGYAVLDDKAALIGTVISSDSVSAKIIPIRHSGFACSVYGEKDLANTFELRGQGLFRDEKELIADQIPRDANISIGDKIYTSGKGGIFPQSVLCGEIIEISEEDRFGNRTAKVQAASQIENQHVLFVLMPSENFSEKDN